MIYSSIYNYFSYLIKTHIPEIKVVDLYMGDFEKIAYPAISIQIIPVNISDIQNGQLISVNVILRLYMNIKDSFDYDDKNKDYSGVFLSMSDKLNYVFNKYTEVPDEIISFPIEGVRRTEMALEEPIEDIHISTITFNFNIVDMYEIITPEKYELERVNIEKTLNTTYA